MAASKVPPPACSVMARASTTVGPPLGRDPQRAAVEGEAAGYIAEIGVVGHRERAGR